MALQGSEAKKVRWPPDIRPLQSPVTDETWERFRQATIDLALERGYNRFEIADIVERAGATRDEFDERFADRAECCHGTYDANIAEFDQALVEPYLRAPTWREGVRAGVAGVTEYLPGARRERAYGEVRLREGGPMELAAKDRYLQRVVDLIDVGRCELDDPDAYTRKLAEAVVGSIYEMMLKRVTEADGEGVGPEVIDEVIYLVERFYVEDGADIRALALSKSDP
jgi:AcrR family transcriptional regulator